MMAEKHAREMSEHMVEEETQKGRKEVVVGKGCVEKEEMIEKGHGNATFGSDQPEDLLNR